jgi:23S rRNA pseudouridine2457 synthase
MATHFQYFMLYKPYGMLSQFTQEQPGQITLSNLPYTFPKDAYPVGRLDADSEGLLLLTNDKLMNQRLLNPKSHIRKTYYAQVEGFPSDSDLRPLRQGVTININGKAHRTLPAEVNIITSLPDLPPRNPPIRTRLSISDTWISITIEEGKNRQVRKMCAAIGFPVLRLIRVALGNWRWGEDPIGTLQPGEIILLKKTDVV